MAGIKSVFNKLELELKLGERMPVMGRSSALSGQIVYLFGQVKCIFK